MRRDKFLLIIHPLVYFARGSRCIGMLHEYAHTNPFPAIGSIGNAIINIHHPRYIYPSVIFQQCTIEVYGFPLLRSTEILFESPVKRPRKTHVEGTRGGESRGI